MSSAPEFRQHLDRVALAAMAVLVLVWGYNWVVMKIALSYAAPFDFAALRTLGASACLLLTVLLLRPREFRVRYVRGTLLLGLLQTLCFVGLVNLALVHGGAGKSSVLVYSMPFWVALLAPIILKVHSPRGHWPIVAMAFAGLLLILSPWETTPDLVSSLLALGAGLFWALSVMVVKKIPVKNNWELLSLTGWQMFAGSVVLLVVAVTVPAHPIHWTWQFTLALLYNIGPGNALAWFLWLFIVTRLPVGISSLNSLAIPVVGVLAAWLQLGERPSRLETMGMLLVFLALALLSFSARAARLRNAKNSGL
ncbi:MAG: DMT family transporter [Gammaproteobacteria bacterium]|nr:DMT family transporter [Gammaproteobacteria bacterium]